MILNVEVRKQGEGYALLEQTASDHRDKSTAVFQGPRDAVESWLAEHGVTPEDRARALAEAKEDSGMLLEVDADYSEAEEFPRLE
jgi:hypothetical protein